MAQAQPNKRQEIIEKLVSYAKSVGIGTKRLTADQLDLLALFIEQFYANAPLEDLEKRSIVNLYGMVYSQWQLLSEQLSDTCKIQVFNPHFEENGWESTHSIVQVNVKPDMPFLVNSMRMELNRLGFTIHLIIHPGRLKVRRNAKGQLIEILPSDTCAKDISVEAPVYMEIDRQTDLKVLENIKDNLSRVFDDVRLSVEDWPKMIQEVKDALSEIESTKLPLNPEEIEESKAFLRWLTDHFTFVGFRYYTMLGKGKEGALQLEKKNSLGVLRDDSKSRGSRYLSELPPAALQQTLSQQILTISQTNTLSTIHRPNAYTYCIGVKTFNESGIIKGERRFFGLFTSEAYNNNPRDLPYLARKVDMIIKKSKLPVASHSAKALLNILETLPRDDLFQGSVDDVCNLALGILHLQERRRIRLFIREDAYCRYISCLVYVPRDNFTTELLYRMQDILQEAFNGYKVTFDTYFPDSILARIHFVIRIDPNQHLVYDPDAIEKKLIEIGRSWRDDLRENILEHYGEEKGNVLVNKYERAFPAGYREVFVPRSAVYDIEHINRLSSKHELEMSFYRPLGAPATTIRFKLYHIRGTIPLSDALPMLENMGLRVIGEQPYKITIKDGPEVWINDFNMVYAESALVNIEEIKNLFQNAFNKTWFGKAENDGFNRLVLGAQLSWREISVLRAYSKYFRQIGFTFSQPYIEEALTSNPRVTKLLIKLFNLKFDPKKEKNRKAKLKELEEEISEALDKVAHLDQDRILRQFREIIHATLRTNYFQKNKDEFKEYLSFKFDSAHVPGMPLPLPKYEIFVYSTDFEGVHLRTGKVARGGIRWSDRREDFRTEILGLMKAQTVKNAVIVPAGAKGGFVPKNLPETGFREAIFETAVECYKNFIRGLLDLTDNLQQDEIVHPKDTIRYDEDDSYLVVAADKGTATFSDIANSIAEEYEYWLGDAFASGGSTGYDHKKMGITARGAWISVERHFQDFGIDPKKDNFTVIGIGDMSGDVFGNGMLLSKHIKLLAAFNHLHIFLDPNPNPAASYKERKRLFELPRSTWEDYNTKLISSGGGVYRRTAKSIALSPEVREMLQIEQEFIEPNELIRALLRAPVDLIWNGGIGTYVKAENETNTTVGDRANDNLRINAKALRCRLIAEGGNLGLTQLARIEYELNGGHINTDFIDNSAGVDCSDHEVNIKILLNAVIANNDMTIKQRNELLVKMADEVSELVLRNNYRQTRAISLIAKQAPAYFNLYQRFIEEQVKKGRLNLKIEFLPDEKVIAERISQNKTLTRPEIAILLAYSKIILKEAILKSELPEDKHFIKYIESEFPTYLRENYLKQMEEHHLHREIIATQFSNDLVNDMGFAFVYQMHDETGATPDAVVCAYAAARAIFNTRELWLNLERLNYKVDNNIQKDMLIEVVRLLRRSTRWLLRNRPLKFNIDETIEIFSESVEKLYKKLFKILTGSEAKYCTNKKTYLLSKNVPEALASRIATTRVIYSTLNIVEVATDHHMDIDDVAEIYFTLAEQLDLGWFREHINAFEVSNHWAILARAAFKGDLDLLQQALTAAVLHENLDTEDIHRMLESWFKKQEHFIGRWRDLLSELRSSNAKDFAMLTVAMRELTDLAQLELQSHKTV